MALKEAKRLAHLSVSLSRISVMRSMGLRHLASPVMRDSRAPYPASTSRM